MTVFRTTIEESASQRLVGILLAETSVTGDKGSVLSSLDFRRDTQGTHSSVFSLQCVSEGEYSV